MKRTIGLKIRNFRVVESAGITIELTIEPGVNILYGPNASGKSTIIYALLSMMDIRDDELAGRLYLSGEAEITVSSNSTYVKFSRGKYSCRSREEGGVIEGSVDEVRSCLREFWENVGVRTVGYMCGDTLKVYNVAGSELGVRVEYGSKHSSIRLSLKIWEQQEWEELTSLPQVFDGVLEDINDVAGVSYLHAGYARRGGTWIPVELLGYGERRAIALMLAAKYSDLIIVEGFEAGLHADLAVYLLNKLSEKSIIVETHMGVLLSNALENRWKVYYVYDGEAKEVTRENILSLDLIRREIESYTRAGGV